MSGFGGGFIGSLRRDGEKRSRVFSALWLIGLFATLPIPQSGRALSWNIGLVFLWTAVGLLAWSAYYRPAWLTGLWLLSFVLSAVLFWKFKLLLPLALLVLWALWMGFRSRRLDEERGVRRSLALALIVVTTTVPATWAQDPNAAPSIAAPAQTYALPGSGPPPDGNALPSTPVDATAQPVPMPVAAPDIIVPADPNADKKKKEEEKKQAADAALLPAKDVKLNRQQEKRRRDSIDDFKRSREDLKRSLPKSGDAPKEEPKAAPVESKVEIPKYMAGYTVRDLVSCAVIDRVPWRFRPDQRKTRMLLKDSMRFQNQTRYYNWEFYQAMDREGFVSYIIRRPIAGGRYESIVVKDAAYNRIIDDPKKGPKIIESQDLKNLINRETLVFYHQDGSTISYLPSSIGNSVVTIAPTSTTGRQIPPLFLRGSVCDRPSDLRDSDQEQDKIQADRNKNVPAVPVVK